MQRAGAWPAFAVLITFAFLLCVPPTVGQQFNPALTSELKAAIAVEQQIPIAQRRLFSGALQNYLAFGHTLLDPPDQNPDDDAKPVGGSATLGMSSLVTAGSESTSARGSAAQVSNLGFDLLFSRLGGFTQSTTSTAWCGRNVVVGFNDSTATLDSIVLQATNTSGEIPASSQLGVAFSADNGKTFTDLAQLEPGLFPNALVGNPSLVCVSANRFYYASAPFFSGTADFSSETSGVALNVSEDGGRHWSAPISAVSKDVFSHILDKEWLAVDPANRNRLYITYTDFDSAGLFGGGPAACPGSSRIAVEMVRSIDGGRTWSAPSVVREDCIVVDPVTGVFNGHSATGSQVSVGPDGTVYASYLLFGSDGSEQIVIRRSSDHGASFSPEVTVADVTPAGIGGFLQGFFFDQGFHSMAVDNSLHDSRGTIYVAWSDGRDHSQIDVVSPTGQYSFGDILLSRSTDGGASWSNPAPVSPTSGNFKGSGRDQFQPGVAVNSEGKLAVCYYDRRNDSQNNLVDHYCSISQNQGATFNDIRLTSSGWVPAHATDELVGLTYLGDYDTVTSESTGQQKGFFSSFQVETSDTPNVQGRSF